MLRMVFGVSIAVVLAGGAAAQETGSSDEAAEAEARRLETVLVTSRAQELYRVDETASGKLPGAPLTSPLNIAVITSELIADQGARDAQDLYRNISGVSFFSYGGVTARGFRQEEIYFDGLRGDPYSGFSVPQLFNVERVEFLKGPAGMLYGPGAPGGLFNYLTKVPGETFSANTAIVVGTEARYGASAELTGPIAGASGLRGRLGAFYEDRNTQRRNSTNESLILDAGLSFDAGPAEVILQATRYEQDLAGNRLRGVPVDAAGRFLTDRRWNHNEASDFLRLEAEVAQARVVWPITDSIDFDAGLRYATSLETQQYHEPNGLFDSDADGRVDSSRRQFRDQIRDGDGLTFGTNLVWRQSLGPVENRLLVGADAFTGELTFDGRSLSGTNAVVAGRPTPLSLFNPAYGQTQPSTYLLPAFTRSVTEQERLGSYLLNEATLGRIIATAGVRFDKFEDVSGAARFEDEATSFRAGLVYRLTDEVSVYGQWADSFEPQGVASQDTRAGGPFAPTEGEIVEAGVKTALAGGRLQTSASIYQIIRTNILQADPRGDVSGDGVNDLVSFGEVTSEGFEADIAADLTDNWVLTANYAYNDTLITKTNSLTALTNSVGDRFANAPEHTFGFWTRYQFPARNLALALGGDYVDVRRSLSNQKVRPYTIFDASIIYEPGPVKLLLRVDNLLDEVYAASGFIDRTGHFPGEPRSVFLEISKSW